MPSESGGAVGSASRGDESTSMAIGRGSLQKAGRLGATWRLFQTPAIRTPRLDAPPRHRRPLVAWRWEKRRMADRGSVGQLQAPPEALLHFVGDVARAETVEDLETRYLDGIRDFVGGFAAGLYVLNPFTHGAQRYAARGVSDFFLSRYEELGRARDPVLHRALADGAAVDNRMLMSVEEWRNLPVYGEVFGLHRMTGLLEVPLAEGGEVIGTLNFGRNDSDGPFTDQERAMAQAIAHLVGVALVSVRDRDRLARERDRTVA